MAVDNQMVREDWYQKCWVEPLAAHNALNACQVLNLSQEMPRTKASVQEAVASC